MMYGRLGSFYVAQYLADRETTRSDDTPQIEVREDISLGLAFSLLGASILTLLSVWALAFC